MRGKWKMHRIRFLSTPSVGRATRHSLTDLCSGENFYPRPPWGGRLTRSDVIRMYLNISIHALRGEGDQSSVLSKFASLNFYPRPPWGGRHYVMEHIDSSKKISIHALRGEGDIWDNKKLLQELISIHALRGEGDTSSEKARICKFYFYPRPPWGGRPRIGNTKLASINISIHALRGEGDLQAPSCKARASHFYPRPPWGGRQCTRLFSKATARFLSTPSVGRAT